MNIRRFFINVLIVFSFFCCYMEWGTGQSAFAFQVFDELFKSHDWWQNLIHPVILAGLSGIILLLMVPFLRKQYKWLQLAGIVLPGLVVAIILLTGILSANPKTILSCMPFMVMVIIYFRYGNNRSSRSEKPSGDLS